MEDLLKAIDVEKQNRFTKSWSKLERGTKLNRLNDFIESEKEKKELNDKEHQDLQTLLTDLFEKSVFSKSKEIDYCEKETKIIAINNLIYDEETKTYSFNLPKKLVKPASKSKSKIDRHFSRSKENKK
tara:strand:+ start:1822 stop:2205 length:384 start_codon:yes stop_codon:yes gene_type:complete